MREFMIKEKLDLYYWITIGFGASFVLFGVPFALIAKGEAFLPAASGYGTSLLMALIGSLFFSAAYFLKRLREDALYCPPLTGSPF